VFTQGADVLTSSRLVAEVFGERHADVLADIDALNDSRNFRSRSSWFLPVTVETATGQGAVRRFRAYDMTRKGFTVLTMGFQGDKALAFKLAKMDEFNRMEAALREREKAPVVDLTDAATH
jgi:Rha family phage regulatory protein